MGLIKMISLELNNKVEELIFDIIKSNINDIEKYNNAYSYEIPNLLLKDGYKIEIIQEREINNMIDEKIYIYFLKDGIRIDSRCIHMRGIIESVVKEGER